MYVSVYMAVCVFVCVSVVLIVAARLLHSVNCLLLCAVVYHHGRWAGCCTVPRCDA